MFNHLLFAIALMAFSAVSAAAAAPKDVSLALEDAAPAVLHKDVVAYQGGADDKDVGVTATLAATIVSPAEVPSSEVNKWFVAQGHSSAWQPFVVLLAIVGLIVFFVARQSESAK